MNYHTVSGFTTTQVSYRSIMAVVVVTAIVAVLAAAVGWRGSCISLGYDAGICTAVFLSGIPLWRRICLLPCLFQFLEDTKHVLFTPLQNQQCCITLTSLHSHVCLTTARKESLLLRTCVIRLCVHVCMLSCVWIYDPMDCSMPGSPVLPYPPRVRPLALSLLLTCLHLCNFSLFV